MNNLSFVIPEIFISLSIMFLLILGVFKKNSSNLIHYLSVGFLLIVVSAKKIGPFLVTTI